MKNEELQYLERAFAALRDPELTQMTEAKLLRIISQITDRAAREIEQNLVDTVDDLLYNKQTKQT